MNTAVPTRTSAATARTGHALTAARRVVAVYAAVSVLTVLAVVLLRHHHALVTSLVWGRTVIVAALALVTVAITRRAARGSSRALLRLRIVTPIMLAALVAFAVLPGALPGWVRVEQGVCGVLVAVLVVLVHRPAARR